ncbi:hypothetical protein ERO13_D02G163701v2 [Gossypium hirsutum]|uniref:Uncharacterized protein n=4 Tax=Gossypium TaxID=3633 RepID=A0A5J5SF21_GOSBA|nr:hypothetical protein ES319_D02G189000v1 [Gossypium barbadense]KAG4159241.1 hypothetical protein ERO13_D02G163701v2 [Gossypium hirsutum]TYG80282.1 hypothetical protein ES288_D02G203900v1 [Gossypium darwinii]TYH84595.1 hypothetical protein ES332_D02G207200v1 [Gossypium tomentosum]TYI94302.1 hypothetical protein E1A91_D02G193700v1 [Gossypium mustelinum]
MRKDRKEWLDVKANSKIWFRQHITPWNFVFSFMLREFWLTINPLVFKEIQTTMEKADECANTFNSGSYMDNTCI